MTRSGGRFSYLAGDLRSGALTTRLILVIALASPTGIGTVVPIALTEASLGTGMRKRQTPMIRSGLVVPYPTALSYALVGGTNPNWIRCLHKIKGMGGAARED